MESAEYKTVLISGAGELGSRYLQSMVSCGFPLQIYVHSDNSQSLELCRQRWVDVNGDASRHRMVVCQTLDGLPDRVDLAIVSSTAGSRPFLVESIAERMQVKYWLIEKVLAQSVSGIDQILHNVNNGIRSWVNYYMRAEAWYAEIKHHLLPRSPKHMTIYGGTWGLACNALHFIHLHAWFTGSRLVSLNTDSLSNEWYESKRPGNWEVFGELRAGFEDGSRLDLLAEPGPTGYSLSLQDGSCTWQIDEPSGIAQRSDGLVVKGRVPYQSERKLVEEILSTGDCRLPTLAEIAASDRLYIDVMLKHWRQHKDPAALLLPIT